MFYFDWQVICILIIVCVAAIIVAMHKRSTNEKDNPVFNEIKATSDKYESEFRLEGDVVRPIVEQIMENTYNGIGTPDNFSIPFETIKKHCQRIYKDEDGLLYDLDVLCTMRGIKRNMKDGYRTLWSDEGWCGLSSKTIRKFFKKKGFRVHERYIAW